jgi:hypothetical protein
MALSSRLTVAGASRKSSELSILVKKMGTYERALMSEHLSAIPTGDEARIGEHHTAQDGSWPCSSEL